MSAQLALVLTSYVLLQAAAWLALVRCVRRANENDRKARQA